jgi:hypothetical protein
MVEEYYFAGELAVLREYKKLDDILWIVKNVATEFREFRLFHILNSLVKTVEENDEEKFLYLIYKIVYKLDSIEALNPLSKVIHYLADVIQDVKKSQIETTSVVGEFVSLIDALRNSRWGSTDASVMIWTNIGDPTIFPKMFTFQCNCNTEYFEVELSLERLAALQHNTTAMRLIQILNLLKYNENSTVHKFLISQNRSAEKEWLADIGPVGFVYCGVQFTEEEETDITESRIYGPLEQRYGGCALKFNHGQLGGPENSEEYNFYKLGTKSYAREWSQLILVDRKRPNENVGRKWKVVDEASKEFHTVEAMTNTEEDPSWPWILKYCKQKGCWKWTHPTLIFPETLRLDKITCTFGTHQCIANRRCLECKIAIDKNGNVRATKVSAAGKQPNVELNIPDLDGRRLASNTNHGWTVFPIVSLYVFALSVPLVQREFLINMQADGNKKVFNDDQFTEIQGFWNRDEAEDCHYQDWTTDF